MFPEYRDPAGLSVALHAYAAVSERADKRADVVPHQTLRRSKGVEAKGATDNFVQHSSTEKRKKQSATMARLYFRIRICWVPCPVRKFFPVITKSVRDKIATEGR